MGEGGWPVLMRKHGDATNFLFLFHSLVVCSTRARGSALMAHMRRGESLRQVMTACSTKRLNDSQLMTSNASACSCSLKVELGKHKLCTHGTRSTSEARGQEGHAKVTSRARSSFGRKRAEAKLWKTHYRGYPNSTSW